MQNTGLNEAQAGIKIARRNINNFRYADDSILMGEGNGTPLQYSCVEIPWTEEPGGLHPIGCKSRTSYLIIN